MQKVLDTYQAGVQITQVQMQKVDPPAQVIESFREVQAARADLVRAAERSRDLRQPEGPGGAAARRRRSCRTRKPIKSQTVAEATGQASRFGKVYEEYKKAPQVTRQRLYLETMERVFGGTDKIILDSGSGGSGNNSGVVPILPLNEMTRRPTTGGTQ